MDNVNYLFVAVIVAMIIGVYKGYRKGFLRLAVYFAGLILVVILATKISPWVSDFLIDNTSIYEDVRIKIINIYSEKNGELDNTIKENQDLTIYSYGLPDLISGALVSNNTQDMYHRLAAALFEEYISGYLAKIVIKAGSYFILFVILGIIMMCVLTAVKIIEKIPVLRTFNRLIGMLTGLGMSVMLVWVFYLGIMMLFADSLGKWLLVQVQTSKLLLFLFNNNLLFQIIL